VVAPAGWETKHEAIISVPRKRRERRTGSLGIVAGLAEPRRRRILLPERSAAAVSENAVPPI
jgi:hypothetical protein